MINSDKESERGGRVRSKLLLLLSSVLVAVMLAATVATASAANGVIRERTDVLGQGGEGTLEEEGVRLTRRSKSIKIDWSVPTPESGTYDYPTADMIPPGAPPHPEVVAGYPEVFTLWAFVFNYPELCNEACDFDDIGDTPARGGVFQVDATIAADDRITMRGKLRTKDDALVGASLQEPFTAEVHVAMAPHGRAACGDDLLRQLGGSIGNPSFWWPALFV